MGADIRLHKINFFKSQQFGEQEFYWHSCGKENERRNTENDWLTKMFGSKKCQIQIGLQTLDLVYFAVGQGALKANLPLAVNLLSSPLLYLSLRH